MIAMLCFVQGLKPSEDISRVAKMSSLWCQREGMCEKRVMTPHLVCVLGLKGVMAIEV